MEKMNQNENYAQPKTVAIIKGGFVYERVNVLGNVFGVGKGDKVYLFRDVYENQGTEEKPNFVGFASAGDPLETGPARRHASGLRRLIEEGKIFERSPLPRIGN